METGDVHGAHIACLLPSCPWLLKISRQYRENVIAINDCLFIK